MFIDYVCINNLIEQHIMKSQLFKIAHAIRNQFASFSEALVHAWKVIKLHIELKTKKVVNFTYVKVDGSIREAVGTLVNAPMPKGGERKPNYKVLNYFDLQQMEYRCAKVENLIF